MIPFFEGAEAHKWLQERAKQWRSQQVSTRSNQLVETVTKIIAEVKVGGDKALANIAASLKDPIPRAVSAVMRRKYRQRSPSYPRPQKKPFALPPATSPPLLRQSLHRSDRCASSYGEEYEGRGWTTWFRSTARLATSRAVVTRTTLPPP